MLAAIAEPTLAVSSSVIVAGVVVLGVVIAAIAAISTYNRLVSLRVTCKESWADIDAELQRRHDLIPSLISSVKGYVSHENDLLENITELRSRAVSAKKDDPEKRAGVEEMLQGSVGTLIATVEAYPDLQANQNFLKLQKELGETETRIARARRFYNSNVRDFRTKVMTFPQNVLAGMFGFQASDFEFFTANAGDRLPVDVDAADLSRS